MSVPLEKYSGLYILWMDLSKVQGTIFEPKHFLRSWIQSIILTLLEGER